jgi:hypothetical protein
MDFIKKLVLLLAPILLLSSCGAKEMNLNVVVFNYWPRAIADVYVNGQHVGAGYGAFGPGGTGSKTSCCYEIKAGKVKLKWLLSGAVGDPLVGKELETTVELKEVKNGATFLGVYLYPDGTATLDTAKGFPEDKFK